MFTAKPDQRARKLSGGATSWIGVAALALCAGASAADGPAVGQDSLAATNLVAQALAYEHGEGVPKDPLRAAALYCEAARDGDPEAQYSLGWMYLNGRGVPRDDAVAASFLALAAAAGHSAAQKALGLVGDERGLLPRCMHRPDPSPTDDSLDAAALDPFADMPVWKQKIADQVAKIAPRYAVDTRLALAVTRAEDFQHPILPEGQERSAHRQGASS